MKPWLAFFLGLGTCFIVALLLSLLMNLGAVIHLISVNILRTEIPPFFLPTYVFTFLMSHIVECLAGGIVAGYLAKKSGTLIGVLIAYSYLLIQFINFLCCARFNSFYSSVAAQKLFTGYEINWNEMLYVTALLLGALSGKLGEALSQRRRRNSPSSSN